MTSISFDYLIHRAFFQWGLLAYRFRLALLILPILLTIFLSVGFIFIKQQTTIDPQYVFSPISAPWRYERDVLSQHWPINEQEFWPGKSYDYNGYIDIIAAGKNNRDKGRPNMLLASHLNELDRINQYIIYNLTVPVTHNGKQYEVGYTDLCMSYDWKCYLNDHITMLMPKHKWADFRGQLAELANDIITNEVKVTYPIGWRGTEPIYFGALIGSPHLTDEEGHFDYVRAVRLTYNVREEKVGNVSYLWRKKVASYLSDTDNPASEVLEFGMYHNESLPEGLQQVADSLTPKFVITFTILFTLCGLSCVVLLNHNGFFAPDWVRSKPSIALAGLFCPMLAIISAFGSILWCGCLYNAIVNVSPFIVFCIGVDDMFIMSAAWHRTNPDLTVARRLAETLSEAAVAISITSITDMLSFGIGCITTLPSVQMFCLYTFAGIAFTYLYQLTFFTAVMAYAGEWESRGLHVVTFKPAIDPHDADTLFKRLFMVGSAPRKENLQRTDRIVPTRKTPIIQVTSPKGITKAPPLSNKNSSISLMEKINEAFVRLESKMDHADHGLCAHHDRETFISKVFREIYGPFLLSDSTKKTVLFIYLIYISFAILGCSMVEEGLNPKFLVRESFYLNKFYVLMDETFWLEGLQMQVVVSSPPDFFSPFDRRKFDAMMREFENTEFTMKHNATMFWLDAYERKLNEELEELKIPLPTTREEWYERCREWLITAGGRRLWEKDMVWGKNKSDPDTYNHLYAFRFQLGLRNYRTPTDHMRSAQLMRHIAARYSQFNVTTFHEYYPFADQYIELKPALIRNCILALISMLAVSFVMIPNYGAAFAIAGAICSIDLGLIGYMTFWGVRLESVSMITVIMSIGFAVDLSAHIGYAYVKAHGDRHKKAIQALETIGWPVFLGAFSTVLGILVLVTVDAYIVQIFFKTIFLVIIFSMMHGLIFLPVLLTVILPHAKDRDIEDEVCDNHLRTITNGNTLTNENKGKLECISVDDLNLTEIDLSDCKDGKDDQKVMEMAEIEWIEDSQKSESIANDKSLDDEIQFADDASKDSEESAEKRSKQLEDGNATNEEGNGDRGGNPHLDHPEGIELECSIANREIDSSPQRKGAQNEEDKRRMLEVEAFKDAKRLTAINDSKSGVSM